MIRLHFTRWLRFVVFAAGLMLLLAGCARQSIYDAHKDHDHEHAWDYVGDVNATPADAVEGADFIEAPFVLMETASADYNSTTGTAQMAVHDHGTTVTLRLSNLLPNTDYNRMSTRSPVQPAVEPTTGSIRTQGSCRPMQSTSTSPPMTMAQAS